jgi:hypothetical protein
MKFTSIEGLKTKTLTLQRNPNLASYGHIKVTRQHKILLVMKFTSIEASKRKTLILQRNPHLASYGRIEVTRWHKILLVIKYFNRSFKDQNPNSSKEQNPSKVWLYPSQLVAKNSSCYEVYFLRSFKE